MNPCNVVLSQPARDTPGVSTVHLHPLTLHQGWAIEHTAPEQKDICLMVLHVLLLSPSVVGELGVGVRLVFVRVAHPHLQVQQRMVGGVVTSQHRHFGHSVRSPVEISNVFH